MQSALGGRSVCKLAIAEVKGHHPSKRSVLATANSRPRPWLAPCLQGTEPCTCSAHGVDAASVVCMYCVLNGLLGSRSAALPCYRTDVTLELERNPRFIPFDPYEYPLSWHRNWALRLTPPVHYYFPLPSLRLSHWSWPSFLRKATLSCVCSELLRGKRVLYWNTITSQHSRARFLTRAFSPLCAATILVLPLRSSTCNKSLGTAQPRVWFRRFALPPPPRHRAPAAAPGV